MEDLSRTASVNSLWKGGLSAGLLVLLFQLLLFSMLRSHHAKFLAGQELEEYAHAQETAAAHKVRLAAAALKMQQARTLTELARVFLAETHSTFGALQGVVYVAEDTDNQLRLVGSYACADLPAETLTAGEGLLGQCVIERSSRLIETDPANFAMIRSGLGETRPAALILSPVLLGQSLLGVTEIALLHLPDSGEQEQFEELVRLLAMNIEIVGRREHTEEMLSAVATAERIKSEQLSFQQVLVDTIPYPVFTKDADTRFISFNRAYEEAFNVNREDLIGKRVLDLDYLPEADRIAYQTEDEAVIATAGSVKREALIPFTDGKLHETLYFVSGFQRPDGSPGGLVGTFIDISALKDAERELTRLSDLERFNRLAQGREQRILELKREINALAEDAGRPAPYATTLIETIGDHEFKPHPDYRTDLSDSGQPLQLGDLVDLTELQTLLANFCDAVGIAAAIIDPNGIVLAAARWQRACTDFHRVNPDSCARCIESDTELASRLQDGQEYTTYRCANGMTDCASPIVVDGQHLANVFIGQFHTAAPDLAFFREQAQRYGYNQADYLQAINDAPVIDEQRLPSILGFLTRFARMISSLSLSRRQADAAQQLLQQQADLLRQERVAALSLADDADRVRRALEKSHQESQL
jgi:PAS domain S-box-containing protein